jgi:hypothetical protein
MRQYADHKPGAKPIVYDSGPCQCVECTPGPGLNWAEHHHKLYGLATRSTQVITRNQINQLTR